MSDIQEEQKRLYKRAEENDIKFKNLDELDDIEEMRKRYKNLLSCLDKTIFENKELQDRINKTVELLLDKYVRGLLNDNEVNNIVKILKGDNK